MQTDVQVRKARGRLSRHVQNKLGETISDSPAIADGVIYLRTFNSLFAIGKK